MIFFDYYQFGEVAYKCRAFAKALYYKENNFMIKNDFDDIEDLIELYYELKLPESAVGLLKLAEKNKDKIRRRSIQLDRRKSFESSNLSEINHGSLNFEKKDKDKEYILYIKMHHYNEALDIITKQLESENNKENIDTLKKNRDICLNGLNDWEELLLSHEKDYEQNEINNGNEINENKDDKEENKNRIIENESETTPTPKEGEIIENNNNSQINTNQPLDEENKNKNEQKILKENIEKEILLSKACMNLGEWDKLIKHFNKIKELFINNNDIEEQYLINNDEDKKNSVLYEDNDIIDDNVINSVDDNENIFS